MMKTVTIRQIKSSYLVAFYDEGKLLLEHHFTTFDKLLVEVKNFYRIKTAPWLDNFGFFNDPDFSKFLALDEEFYPELAYNCPWSSAEYQEVAHLTPEERKQIMDERVKVAKKKELMKKNESLLKAAFKSGHFHYGNICLDRNCTLVDTED